MLVELPFLLRGRWDERPVRLVVLSLALRWGMGTSHPCRLAPLPSRVVAPSLRAIRVRFVLSSIDSAARATLTHPPCPSARLFFLCTDKRHLHPRIDALSCVLVDGVKGGSLPLGSTNRHSNSEVLALV